MSRKTDEMPTTINYRKKYGSKRKLRRQGMVNFRYHDHPRQRTRTLMVYLLIFVVAFCVLHFGLHVG